MGEKKLTYGKVLSVIYGYIKRQNFVPRKEIALVKTNYGFRLKGYAPRLLDGVELKYASLNQIIIGQSELPEPPDITPALQKQYDAAHKFIARKKRITNFKAGKHFKWNGNPNSMPKSVP